jgi:hypothetical protein
MILIVSHRRKTSAPIVIPTQVPRKNVTMLISSFCAMLVRRSTTPLSRSRFPPISIARSGAAGGTMRTPTNVTASGKMILTFCETGRGVSMTTIRSFSVVSSLMIGGWMRGTRAM